MIGLLKKRRQKPRRIHTVYLAGALKPASWRIKIKAKLKELGIKPIDPVDTPKLLGLT